MSAWQFNLNAKDFYHKYDNGKDDELSLQELAAKMAESIKALLEEIRAKKGMKASIYQFSDMADELENNVLPLFEEIAESEDMDVDDFDNAMSDLYDWADTPLDENFAGAKMCWVATL